MMKNAILIFAGFVLLAFVLNFAANWLEMQPTPEDRKFEVVDKYGNCDVVRYTPTNAAKYYYFLDCPTQRHSVYKND